MSKYQVRLTNEFTAISGAAGRSRANIFVGTGDGYIGDLNADQLKELNEDPYLTVTELKTAGRPKQTEAAPATKAAPVEPVVPTEAVSDAKPKSESKTTSKKA